MREKLRRWGWPLLSGTLALWLLVDHLSHATLVAQNETLIMLVGSQAELLADEKEQTLAYYGVLVDLLQRLGLDDELMPLIPTLFWRKLTHGTSVVEARHRFHAKPGAGFLSDSPAIGGP